MNEWILVIKFLGITSIVADAPTSEACNRILDAHVIKMQHWEQRNPKAASVLSMALSCTPEGESLFLLSGPTPRDTRDIP